MPRFRKKPTEIDAVQWTGENLEAIVALIGVDPEDPDDRPYTVPDRHGVVYIMLTTAQGQQVAARPGEWVVPEARPGRAYPIAPDVFAATYVHADGRAVAA